jgi:hypothetical protein
MAVSIATVMSALISGVQDRSQGERIGAGEIRSRKRDGLIMRLREAELGNHDAL